MLETLCQSNDIKSIYINQFLHKLQKEQDIKEKKKGLDQMEKKVIQYFKTKNYRLDVSAFYGFVNDKVELDSFGMDLLKQKIGQLRIEEQFSEKTLGFFLKLIHAIQLKSSQVTGMSREEIEQFPATFITKIKKSKNSVKEPQQQSNEQVQKPNSPQKIQEPKPKQQEQVKPKIQQQPFHEANKQEKKFKEKKPHIQKFQLPSIEQVDNSTELKLSGCGEGKGPQFLDMRQSKDEANKAKITKYEKFSADYMNPVIKYTIVYKNSRVLRRFSEFQKLINILRQKYEGFILPKLPPKEGIKAGINYFWGIDETFLQQRKKKLQQMLNRLLSNRIINEDEILCRFLSDQGFEIDFNKESYASYLKGITDIVFNAKELKDFGVAYINYYRQKGNVRIDTQIESKFSKIEQLVEVFTALNNYRKRMNKNFDKKRQLLHDLGIESRKPQLSGLDTIMDLIEEEIQDMNYQMDNYKELKSQQSWMVQLIRQKEGDSQRALAELKEQQNRLQIRLGKIERNLKHALEEFYQSKVHQLKVISDKVMEWRGSAHP